MPNPTPRVRLDWNGNGLFESSSTVYTDDGSVARFLGLAGTTVVVPDAGEDVTERVRRTAPIVVKRGRDFARELAPFRAGTTDLVLGNEDGIYSSRNAASPLAGLVKSGRLLDIDLVYGGVTYDIASAFTKEPEELPLLSDQAVRIYALDGLGRAGAAKIYSDMYVDIRIDVALGVVADLIGWPPGLRDLDVFATTLPRWWAAGITGLQAFKELVLSEGIGAMLYVDGRGYLIGESRYRRLLSTRSTTSQATFRDQGAEPLMTRFSVTPGESGIVNSCTIPVRSYALAALAPIWSGPTPLVLQPNEAWTTTVSTSEAGFDNAVDPTAAAGDFTATNPVASATLDRDGGKTATLTIVAPAAGTTLTGLRVRAQTVTITEQLVSNSIDAGQSIDDHGVRTLPDDFVPQWIGSAPVALDFCNAVVGRDMNERPQVVISVNNVTDERLVQALVLRISDRIIAIDTSPRASINEPMTIEAVEYRFDSRGDVFEATFFCEAAVDVNYGLWDQGLWDVALWAY